MNKTELFMVVSVFSLIALFVSGIFLMSYCETSSTIKLVYGRDFETWTLGYKTITYLRFNFPYMIVGQLLLLSEVPIVVLQAIITFKKKAN